MRIYRSLLLGLAVATLSGALSAQPLASKYVATSLAFEPTAINDHRLIIGEKDGKPVRYSNGVLATLPSLSSPQSPYVAVDVNNAGVIVGATGLLQVPAIYWKPPGYAIGGWLDPSIYAAFQPTRVNDTLTIIGKSDRTDLAHRWTKAGGYEILGYAARHGAIDTTDINDRGVVVGKVDFEPFQRVVIWPPGVHDAQAVSSAGQYVFGFPRINNKGTIVWMEDAVRIVSRDPSGHTSDRPIPGYDTITITGFSDAGRLIGVARKGEVNRGWTILGTGPVVWLSAPGLEAGDSLTPTGVNTCGDIISVVRRGQTVGGVLQTHPLACDPPGTNAPGVASKSTH